jgi:hypothetical protein
MAAIFYFSSWLLPEQDMPGGDPGDRETLSRLRLES